jgi:hypothetical protein
MENTVYNPAKGRLESIRLIFASENTAWFEDKPTSDGIYSITDVAGDLLIRESGYSTPLLIQELTRSSINYNHRRARELISQHQ